MISHVWWTNDPLCQRKHLFSTLLQKAPDCGSSILEVELALDTGEGHYCPTGHQTYNYAVSAIVVIRSVLHHLNL